MYRDDFVFNFKSLPEPPRELCTGGLDAKQDEPLAPNPPSYRDVLGQSMLCKVLSDLGFQTFVGVWRQYSKGHFLVSDLILIPKPEVCARA